MRTEPSHLCIFNLKTMENYVWVLPCIKVASRHSLKISFFALLLRNSWLKSILSLAFSAQALAVMFIAHLFVVLAWLISPFSSCPSFALSNQYFSRKVEKCCSHRVTQCCCPHPINWVQSSIVQTDCCWPFMTLQ